jgi:uncharacterized protein YbbC (DUF1343 family)
VYEPVATAARLIDLVRRLHPGEFAWRGANQREPRMMTIDRLAGTDRTTEELLQDWKRDEARFRQIREPYLLYR